MILLKKITQQGGSAKKHKEYRLGCRMIRKLVYSATPIVRSLRKQAIIKHYTTLKNLIIKLNKEGEDSGLPYTELSLGPISSIEKTNIHKIKESIHKERWEDSDKEYFSENTEGDYIFAYEAYYELDFHRVMEFVSLAEKERIYNRGPGYEVYYYFWDFLNQISWQNTDTKTNIALWGESDFTNVDIINHPEYPKEKENEWIDYRMKDWKFAKDLGYGFDVQKEIIVHGESSEVKEYLTFDKRKKIKLTESEKKEYTKIEMEIKAENDAFVEEKRKKIIESWK